MARRLGRVLRTEETAHFVVYDRRTGEILAVHHVRALPGVRAPADDVITRRVRACAAEALGRRSSELAVLTTRRPPAISPALRVDLATGKLAIADRGRARENERRDERTAREGNARLSPP